MPAEVVGACVDDRVGSSHEVGRCLDVDALGRSRRAAAIVQSSSSSGAGGQSAIGVLGFGRKFWTITSWTWPWRSWRLGDRRQRAQTVGAVLADPDEHARGERDGELAGERERREATLGRLVRGQAVRVEVVAQRLEHHPLAGCDRAQRASSSR